MSNTPTPPIPQSPDPTDALANATGLSASPDTGVLAGIKRNTVGMVSGLYHALRDPATDQEKQELLQKVKDINARGGNISNDLATNPSRVTLAYHRLIDAPADELDTKGQDEQKAAKDLLTQGHKWKGGNLYTSGTLDRGLAAVPMVGPWVNSIASRVERGDMTGAATDIASALALEHVGPLSEKVANEAEQSIHTAGEKARESISARKNARVDEAKSGNVITVEPDSATSESVPTVGQSIKEGVKNAVNAKAPEGSAEAGRIKINSDPKSVVESQGLKYKGELVKDSGVHMFEHPDHPGKTATLKEPFTGDQVQQKMASKLKDFGVDMPAPEPKAAPTESHISFDDLGGKEVRPPSSFGRDAVVTHDGKPYMTFGSVPEADAWLAENKDNLPNPEKWESKSNSAAAKSAPPEEKPYVDAAEKAGVEFKGVQAGDKDTPSVLLFQDPVSKDEFAVDSTKWNPKELQDRLADSRERNGVKAPEPAATTTPESQYEETLARRGQLPNQKVDLSEAYGDTGGYRGGLVENRTSPADFEAAHAAEPAKESEPVTKYSNPVLQRMADTFGTKTSARSGQGASFIAPDGDFIHLPADTTHDGAINRLDTEKKYNVKSGAQNGDSRIGFLNDSGSIRVHMTRDRAGDTAHISVPAQGVSEDQIPAIRQVIAQAGRYGNVVLERADVTPETKDRLTMHQEFPRASDTEKYLKQIEAHPEQHVSTNAETAPSTETSPNKDLQKSAQKYAKSKGMDEINHEPVQADPERAKNIAKIYDEAKHDPNNPKVKAAYDALKSETKDQFNHLRASGLKFEPQEEDPYKSAGDMMKDIKQNNRLKVFTGSAPGADHPLSEVDPETGETYNTLFRWVHDAMGHAAGGNDFSENGEKSATEAHAQMYSDKARPAMRAETEGQTSWFFHNPDVEAGKTTPGAFAEQKAMVLPDTSSDWHKTAGNMAGKKEAGGINPRTGKSDAAGFGVELAPEFRKPLDHAPTATDFKNFYDAHKELFDQHPELRVGWDNKSNVPGGHEINVGAIGKDAARVAKKLDQVAAFDVAKGETIPTGGTGLRTDFSNYPIEERMKDLRGENQSDTPGFEHLTKDIYDHLEPDERDFLKDNKTMQRNVMSQYHKLEPSVNETSNAMQAGAALGGWWKRYIDVFHDLAGGGEEEAKTIGPSHAEALKQWHAALSGNKSVQDANNLSWHSYADWLDAGKPTDRKSINDIIKQNAAQPEGSGKKGNGAISDTLDKKGNVVSKGLDTNKLFNLVNSPEMRGERPFSGDVYREDEKNPLMGPTQGARKIPSMGATVAGKGNLNRLVIDTHIRDFYGQGHAGPVAQYIADSAHLRQAAEALGLKGGEGQEQLWGTVLGLKYLLKEGLTPAEASGKLDAGVINKIGKDYAEVIANDPEITRPGGLLDRIKETHGIGRGSAGFSAPNSETPSTGTGEGKPTGSQTPVDTSELGKTAGRIRESISDVKIKKPAAAAAPKKSGKVNAMDIINLLGGLDRPSPRP